MKRKCMVLFILAILAGVYLQMFSGCAKKITVTPGGSVAVEIAAQQVEQELFGDEAEVIQ